MSLLQGLFQGRKVQEWINGRLLRGRSLSVHKLCKMSNASIVDITIFNCNQLTEQDLGGDKSGFCSGTCSADGLCTEGRTGQCRSGSSCQMDQTRGQRACTGTAEVTKPPKVMKRRHRKSGAKGGQMKFIN